MNTFGILTGVVTLLIIGLGFSLVIYGERESPSPMNLAIIGGGIAGLSAAYYAQKKSPLASITLVESSDRWGGKIATDRVSFGDGSFIVEGGPDTFLATKPYATTLCKELGLGERLHGTNPEKKNTYVLSRGRLLPLPDALAMMIPANILAILTCATSRPDMSLSPEVLFRCASSPTANPFRAPAQPFSLPQPD